MADFPHNLLRLHEGEEFLRARSIEAIEGGEDLLAHAAIVEGAMDLIDYFVRHYEGADEDDLTIQLLGIRLFNGSASAMKLLLSGYYQKSALVQRDLLETVFLLSYLLTDRKLISIWRTAEKKERKATFSPAAVRKALDGRDGFTTRKREKHYGDLSELAGHASYPGFRMLVPAPGGDAHCGPFFEPGIMKAVLEELAKIMVQAGIVFTRFFPGKRRQDYEMAIGWMETHGFWFERFYGRPFDRVAIDELHALMNAAHA